MKQLVVGCKFSKPLLEFLGLKSRINMHALNNGFYQW